MRDVGDEILPHAFEPPQLGNVVQHDHRARRFLRGNIAADGRLALDDAGVGSRALRARP